MDSRAGADRLMRELIKLMKTQTAVAKALKRSKRTFNYWLNHAKKVPHEPLLAMEALLAKLQADNVPAKTSFSHCRESKAAQKILQAIHHNSHLLMAEQKYQLPLRAALVGLLAQSDARGYFVWKPEHLKDAILPYVAVNFMKVLEVLQVQGWVQKQSSAATVYGRVVLNRLLQRR